MAALKLTHYLVLQAARDRLPVYQVVSTITDPDLKHGQSEPEVNYFLSKITADDFAMMRRACRFYDSHVVEYSADAVRKAYVEATQELTPPSVF